MINILILFFDKIKRNKEEFINLFKFNEPLMFLHLYYIIIILYSQKITCELMSDNEIKYYLNIFFETKKEKLNVINPFLINNNKKTLNELNEKIGPNPQSPIPK